MRMKNAGYKHFGLCGERSCGQSCSAHFAKFFEHCLVVHCGNVFARTHEFEKSVCVDSGFFNAQKTCRTRKEELNATESQPTATKRKKTKRIAKIKYEEQTKPNVPDFVGGFFRSAGSRRVTNGKPMCNKREVGAAENFEKCLFMGCNSFALRAAV